MTVELLGEDSPPVVVFLLTWLSPLGAVGQTRTSTDASIFPFRQIHILDITPDENLFGDRVLATVRTFCKAETATQRADAVHEARLTDQRLMLMSRDLDDVVLPDGTVANCEYFDVPTKSVLIDYKVDTIHCYKAEVSFGLSYVAV